MATEAETDEENDARMQKLQSLWIDFLDIVEEITGHDNLIIDAMNQGQLKNQNE